MGGAEHRSRGAKTASFLPVRALISSPFHLAGSLLHDARLDSRQSGSGGCRQRHHQDPRRRRIALRALGAAGRAQGHRLRLHRAQRADREIFRDRARLARARLCGGDDRLARPGSFVAAAARSAQGLCARFLRFRDRRRNLRAAGGAAGLPAALFRAGAFDGRRRDAAGRACRQTLVRPHGAVGADDRPAGTRGPRFRRARCCGSCGSPGRAAATFRAAATR